ncbi:MAG: Ig-like domain-containing protein [Patescibacteria group bacterium]
MHRPLAHPFRPFARALIVLIVAFCVVGFFAVAFPALAQDTSFEQFADASTLSQDSIAIIIARVIRVALTLVGIIFVCVIIYAGFLYLLARGEPEPIKKAKKIFQQSIIGLIIIFSAYSIATFILNRLLDAAFTGSSAAVADAYSEPLSGSLGGGILDDHYPERDATEIPRNTRIFVTFKEAINPASMISGYDEDPDSTDLNTDSVVIYPTDEGPGSALASDEVVVTHDEGFEIFVFDPVEYLGSSEQDTNYTVSLTTDIERASGTAAFSGAYASGYSWTFEVSTEIDLTPPYVTSIVPAADADEPRNVTVEINFSEAMDPVATTGSYIIGEEPLFTNIEVLDAALANVEGTFEISNAYRTISFTTTDACGEDPCGDTIYCLPTNQLISAMAKAATLNEEEIPQAEPTGYTFDGVVDAAANSLDGDNDYDPEVAGTICGSESDTIECEDAGDNDNYEWSFTTNDEIEDTVPQIITGGLDPEIEEDEISTSADVEVTFNSYLKSSTVNTSSVSLWPDPYYEFWFAIRKSNDDVEERTTVLIEHPTLVSTDLGGWDYWPVLSEGIKSAYQICMYPAIGPGSNCTEGRDEDQPYCCNGISSASACQTEEQEAAAEDETLPDNTETEL